MWQHRSMDTNPTPTKPRRAVVLGRGTPDPELARQELHARISNDFSAHPPKTPEAKQLFDEIAAQCEGLAHYLIEVCPDGRELSLALTDLELAKRDAVAAIACHQDD